MINNNECYIKIPIDCSNNAPSIGENGNWYIGDTDTGIKAQGKDGEPGEKGDPGEPGLQGVKGDKGDTGLQEWPDYSKPIIAATVPYTAPEDGYLIGDIYHIDRTNCYISINDTIIGWIYATSAGGTIGCNTSSPYCYPVKKGDIFTVTGYYSLNVRFFPLRK